MALFVDLMIKRKVVLDREVTRLMNYLGLREEDLRITRTRGANDPAPN